MSYISMMSEDEITVSKINYNSLFIIIGGGILSLILGIYMFVSHEDLASYIGLISIFFGMFSIRITINYDILYITDEELIVKTINGKVKNKYRLDLFKRYREIEKETLRFPNIKWVELILIGSDANNNFQFNSKAYSNFPELKYRLTRNLKRSKDR